MSQRYNVDGTAKSSLKTKQASPSTSPTGEQDDAKIAKRLSFQSPDDDDPDVAFDEVNHKIKHSFKPKSCFVFQNSILILFLCCL